MYLLAWLVQQVHIVRHLALHHYLVQEVTIVLLLVLLVYFVLKVISVLEMLPKLFVLLAISVLLVTIFLSTVLRDIIAPLEHLHLSSAQ